MRCLLIAVALAAEQRVVASTQAQDVCTGACCTDDSCMSEVSLVQKNFEFQKRTENLSNMFNASRKTVEEFEVDAGELTEEFAFLTGHIFQKADRKEEDQMGWVPSKTMTYMRESWAHTATLFKKGNMCALVFFESSDPFFALDTKSFCKAEGVNVKYTTEMEEFMKLEAWKDVIAELTTCGEVHAVGHSIGGAMATLFAFCANTQATDFGELPEVRLYTLGAPGPAMTVLYNGSPGTCFKGVRQFVGDEPKPASRAFHVENLLQFADIAEKISQAWRAIPLKQAVDKLTALPEGSPDAIALLQKQHEDIGDMWLVVYLALRGDEKVTPMLPNYKSMFEAFMDKYASELIYNYDPVPQVALGYMHPLVNVEPIANTKVSPDAVGSTGRSVQCDANMPQVPKFDYAQLVWGSLRFNKGGNYKDGGIPNHGACCAISEADCSRRYEDASDMVCRLFSKDDVMKAQAGPHL